MATDVKKDVSPGQDPKTPAKTKDEPKPKEDTKSEKPAEEAKKEEEVKKDEEKKGKEEKSEKSENIVPLNVLVIDDSKALRRVIVKYLQNKFHCIITEVDNGKEGLQVIAEKKGNMALVLCDLMMPVMDGITFLSNLKSNQTYQNIPVIFLTAKNDRDTVTKCIKLGAIDFIIKPYDLAAVSKKLTKFLTPKV